MTKIEKKNQAATNALYAILYGGKKFEYDGKELSKDDLEGFIRITKVGNGVSRVVLCVKNSPYASIQIELKEDGKIETREAPHCICKSSDWNTAVHKFNDESHSCVTPYFASYSEV